MKNELLRQVKATWCQRLNKLSLENHQLASVSIRSADCLPLFRGINRYLVIRALKDCTYLNSIRGNPVLKVIYKPFWVYGIRWIRHELRLRKPYSLPKSLRSRLEELWNSFLVLKTYRTCTMSLWRQKRYQISYTWKA